MTICPYYDETACTCNAGPSYHFHPYKEWRSWIRENCKGDYAKCAAYIGHREDLRLQHNQEILRKIKEEHADKTLEQPLEHFSR